MKKFNESLLKKSLPSIVIIAFSVPATFFLSYNLIKTHAKNAALRDIAVIAESYRGQVCQFLEMTRRRAQDFASDGFIRTRLPKEIRGREVSVNNLSKYLAENKITLDESIKTIHVLSMEGRVVASTDNSEIGKDLSNETFFIKGKDAIALVENTAVYDKLGCLWQRLLSSPLERGAGGVLWQTYTPLYPLFLEGRHKRLKFLNDELPELAVSAPLFSMRCRLGEAKRTQQIGVLVNTIRLSELNKMLSVEYRMEDHSIRWDKGRWKSMEVYLVNRDKRMITNSIFVKDAVLKQVVNTLPVATGLTTKKEMAGFYKDYRGIVVAGASKPIPQLEWVLLTEIDEDEILSFMKLMLMSAPIPAGIIIIVGIALFITLFKTERMKAQNTLEEQSCLTALGADIGVALIQHGNLRDILQKYAEALVKNLDVAFARIWTFNKETNMLELQSSAGIYTHTDGQHNRIPVDMFQVGLIDEERKPYFTNSVTGDPKVPDQEWARQTGMVSYAGYPLTVDNRLVGIMAIFDQKPLTEITLKALASVSDSIALGIDHMCVKENLLTEKKRMEEEQNTLREHLYHSQKLESVGTLAGGIAHDFNNILSIIIGYGNLLEKSLGKGIPPRIYIQKILKSAERATNLVQGLLAFSRKQGSCQKPAPINSILLPVKNLLSRLIGEDIVLDIVPAKKDCIVMADSGQMEQVFINLATNARDAMPRGGTLTITTEVIELDDEFIKVHGYGEMGKYVLISVKDTGIGMDKETQRRIFQPFFTTKEVGKGTGLGLSIVYGIIKQHGGYINVKSEPGRGATFMIYLPLIKSTVAEEKPTSLPAYLIGTEMILVAEDEEDVRNLAKSLLEEAGYKVIAAVDGYDTINKFMKNKDNINFLLLDVIMPTKNGREAYEEIRKIRPDIKALFMSGYSESVVHKKTTLKEDFHFISKPFSQTMLLKKVREILDNSIVSI